MFVVHVIRCPRSKVMLSWDPPIIDGGAPVFEHEVSYSVHEVVRKDKYSREDVVKPAEPVLTSRYALLCRRHCTLVAIRMADADR